MSKKKTCPHRKVGEYGIERKKYKNKCKKIMKKSPSAQRKGRQEKRVKRKDGEETDVFLFNLIHK